MSTSIIDLPESLQPATFLQNVEVELPDKSLEIVDLCKEAGRRRDGKLAKQAAQGAKRWWAGGGGGDRFGPAVALLWVADFSWRNWKSYQRNRSELKNVIECCEEVKNWILEPVPVPGFQRTGTDWPAAISRGELRQKLVDFFNEQELRDLCYDIGVNYDALSAVGTAGVARELTYYLERLSRIPELIEKCSELRPDGSWGEVSETTRKIVIPPSSLAARLIASRTIKAVACYLSGLSYQMLGNVSEASDSYQEALKWFRDAQSGWRGEGNNDRAKAFERVLEWLDRLKKYVYTIRLDPLPGMKLICPWRHGDRERYLVAEVPLTAPVTIDSVRDDATTAKFLRQRRREWLWIGGAQIDGYKIKTEESLRALDVDGFIKYFTFDQLVVNPETQLGGHLVLPAGTTYYVFQDWPAPSQYKAGDGETTIVFERDLERRVQVTQVIQPAPRVLGSADYALLPQPSVPPPPKPLRILGAP